MLYIFVVFFCACVYVVSCVCVFLFNENKGFVARVGSVCKCSVFVVLGIAMCF